VRWNEKRDWNRFFVNVDTRGRRAQARCQVIREADRAETEARSIQMEGYGGPAQPSPTIGQCLNGGYPATIKLTHCPPLPDRNSAEGTMKYVAYDYEIEGDKGVILAHLFHRPRRKAFAVRGNDADRNQGT
jgi:hypothetical protein